eukprot:SAG31_NODE_2014_length_6665_cov_2.737435_5_plen_49_part_00
MVKASCLFENFPRRLDAFQAHSNWKQSVYFKQSMKKGTGELFKKLGLD